MMNETAMVSSVPVARHEMAFARLRKWLSTTVGLGGLGSMRFHWERGHVSRLHSLSCFVRQRCAQITLTRVTSDRHNQFALVFRTLGRLQRRPYVGPGRNAGQNTLFQRQLSRDSNCVLVTHCNDIVHNLQVEVLGDEPCPRALNLVRPRLEWFAIARLRDDRRIFWLDSDGPEAFLPRLEHFADARERAASADRRDRKSTRLNSRHAK